MTDRECVEQYIPMVKFIAAIMGPRCEVVLHDLKDVDHSIVAIEHGYISGRKVGDGLMDFVLSETFAQDNCQNPFVLNLQRAMDNDERKLLFSSYYIRNGEGEIVGFLGVNSDITELNRLKAFVDRELNHMGLSAQGQAANGANMVLSAHELADSALQVAIEEVGCMDISHMTKQEKIQVMTILNENNLFSLKGMISIVARRLGISDPSVYRLLREAKDTANHNCG